MNTAGCCHPYNRSPLKLLFLKFLLATLLALPIGLAVSAEVDSCLMAVELDGANDLVNIPDLTLLGDFTLEGWVKLAPGIDHKDSMFGDGVYTHLYFAAGKPRLYAYGVRLTGNTVISADTWTHIAVTRSGSNLTMYVNGEVDATGFYPGSLAIKFFGKGYRGYFEGMMDEIRIWDLARTDAEINATYNTSIAPNAVGLLGNWTFNGSGQTVFDSSLSANDGSLGINTMVAADDPIYHDATAPINENCDGEDPGGDSNVAPIAVNDDASVQRGNTVIINILTNDTDDGSLNPSSVSVSSSNYGVVALNDNGSISYSNNAGSTAMTDTFSYTVKDNEGVISNTATVTITITDQAPENEAPVAENDAASVQRGETVIIDVLANDNDDDSLEPSTVIITSDPSAGMAVYNGDGTITYMSNIDSLASSDTLSYTVQDNEGAISNEATVVITVFSTTASCGIAVKLDGANDLVNVPDLVLSADFTLEGWVKLAPGIDHKDGMFGDGVYTHLNFAAGKPRLYAYGVRLTGNTAIPADTWTHIAVTRSGSNLTMYVNGVEDATGVYPGSLIIKYLGKGHRGYFEGMMDEFRIWDVARTNAEIDATYNTSVAPDAVGLLGNWTFNSNDQTVIDSSLSANHGSLGVNTTAGTDDPLYQNSTAPLSESCDEEELDTTAPVISNIQAVVSDSTVTISWDTDEPATSNVAYGLDDSYTATPETDGTLVTQHSLTITGLTELTDYHFQISSEDASGNSISSADQTVTTEASPLGCTTPWGDDIDHQTSVSAYQQATVAFGNTCVEETQICDNGVLSGSYTHQQCQVLALQPPQNLIATANNGAIELSWSPVINASSYNLHYSEDATFPTDQTVQINNVQSPYNLTGLNNDVIYYLAVTAVSNSVESLFSNEVSATPKAKGKLNDTGITWGGNYPSGNNTDCSGAEISAQDCSHGRDAQALAGTLSKIGAGSAGFDFTKLDAEGAPLPANASSWSCVKDNHTGLIWEAKTDNGDIHDKDNAYRWGGETALGNGTVGTYYDDWTPLVTGSNSETLCGYSDWRIPSSDELITLLDLSRIIMAIDMNYFPNTASSVWSSSPYAHDLSLAWLVYFGNGYSSLSSRSHNTQVRLVRSGQ